MKKYSILFVLVASLLFSCGKDKDKDNNNNNNNNTGGGNEEVEILVPTVSILEVIDITSTSAKVNAIVENDGGAEVTARGVEYACASFSEPDHDCYMGKIYAGSGVGEFQCEMTDLYANETIYVRAFATNEAGTAYGEEVVFTTIDPYNGYEYVDLGLPSGTKWATCNVGATSPEEVGRYYAWGDPKAKIKYSAENCPTYGMELGDISGNPDYDIATIVWGGAWRMPTAAEARELIDNCSFVWDAVNNVAGAVVTGPNGNSIFLPAGGFVAEVNVDFADSEGAYWTSSPDPTDYYNYSRFFYFYNTNFANIGDFSRYAGLLVRPVTD